MSASNVSAGTMEDCTVVHVVADKDIRTEEVQKPGYFVNGAYVPQSETRLISDSWTTQLRLRKNEHVFPVSFSWPGSRPVFREGDSITLHLAYIGSDSNRIIGITNNSDETYYQLNTLDSIIKNEKSKQSELAIQSRMKYYWIIIFILIIIFWIVYIQMTKV